MNHIILTHSDLLTTLADELPCNKQRQSFVQGLLHAYKLDQQVEILPIIPIEWALLEQYHDTDFIKELQRPRDDLDKQSEDYKEIMESVSEEFEGLGDKEDELLDDSNDEKYGLAFDCCPFPFMRYYVNLTAASTIQLARKIAHSSIEIGSGRVIGINWYGGRHHCHRSKCSGFCYINDIVLGITTIRKMFSGNVFYLDLDLHNGDGVAEAFKYSKKVATCSVHRCDVGFFPAGSGKLEDSVSGMYNVPTKRGLTDEGMLWILQNVVFHLIDKHQPEYLVVQLGCDGLNTDPSNEWNMTIQGYSETIRLLIERVNIPVMVLGGGGYNYTEVAKCWTYVTGALLGYSADNFDEIPEHKLLDHYEVDGYRFWTDSNLQSGKMKNENDLEYLQCLQKHLLSL
ncbi:Hos1 histone deacetylase [Candida orthopsilosis Co 90-125]|uniref:Hos1 histone deacetylase n=1 Tax=Candida orthopsilosis (strain 90-125) TaxID=1136231 RepID=H8X0J3_CANO9|nr:Hos1 histone deacetylase [Candida orthopsilosis Co 90-125]CCG21882.1 Hos1 histone deacetylase [Candida orthopsilosis Co 90-125]